jgi:hypothetical protein
VTPLAHVGGMPVEELLPFAPVVWVAIGAVGAHLTIWRKGRG